MTGNMSGNESTVLGKGGIGNDTSTRRQVNIKDRGGAKYTNNTVQDSIQELKQQGHKDMIFKMDNEKYESIITPTLNRLNIHEYDKKQTLSQIIPLHLKEIFPKYKKELKTVDTEKIKDIIFRKVYNEMLGIEMRKAAQKFHLMHKDDDSDDDVVEPADGKSVISSPTKMAKSVTGGFGDTFKKSTQS
jgi:hypothetical protein